MSIFKPTTLKQSFLKMGIYGNAKSGKTYTSSLVAIGLHKMIGSKKPVAFFDTETGSEYVLPTLYKPAGIEMISVKSRSFSDLQNALKECIEGAADILIVDSISHVWLEIQKAYKTKKGLTYISIPDWGPIKEEWSLFTTAYLNSNVHVIVCGRAQDLWAETTDSQGRKEKNVVGTKMQTEKNLAYEPSLLVEMEKEINPMTGFLTPRAWIIGDRFSQIDGKAFDNPTFETFLAHITMLNIGGSNEGVDASRTSEALFNADDGQALAEIRRKQSIYIEQIEGTLVAAFPGQSAEEKKKKLALLNLAFNSYSWQEIQSRPVEVLMMGLQKIKEAITADLATLAEDGADKPKKEKVTK